MFSGIVEEMGVVAGLTKGLGGTRLTIMASTVLEDVTIGASLSVNGTCLTVVTNTDKDFSVDVSPETMQVTTLGSLAVGSPVNLERAMKLNERIGGHLVSGHVDGVGEVLRFDPVGDNRLLEIRAPESLARYIARKGSISVDGVSLTTNSVDGAAFSINLIPHTLASTTLGCLQTGSRVNLEVDLIARYCERLLVVSCGEK